MTNKREELIRELEELAAKLAEQGIYIAGTCAQVAQLLREDGEEIERIKKERDAWMSERHQLAKLAYDEDTHFSWKEIAEELRGELEEALGKNDLLRGTAKALREAREQVFDQVDRLKAALVEIEKNYPHICGTCPAIAKQALTQEDSEGVCEECGGSGVAIGLTHPGGVGGVGDIPCPKGCQPQTPGNVITGERERSTNAAQDRYTAHVRHEQGRCPECGTHYRWRENEKGTYDQHCPKCQPTKDKDCNPTDPRSEG